MTNHQPTVAFGRYPCCNAMRPLAILENARLPVYESCPSCGTLVTRVFNGFLHVMALREASRQIRVGKPFPAFRARRAAVKPIPFGWLSVSLAHDMEAIEQDLDAAWDSRRSRRHH